jgi:hypothetical protein
MATQFVISGYIEGALVQAEYDKSRTEHLSAAFLHQRSDRIWADSKRMRERTTVDAGRLVACGFRLGHALPVIDGIDLNKEPTYEPVDTV